MNENGLQDDDKERLQVGNKIKNRYHLRTVLLVPFLLHVIFISGLVGYISYLNGQKAVTEVADRLHSEINSRIEEYLGDFIETPVQIIHGNAAAINQGLLNHRSQYDLEKYFWEQMQIYKTVSSIYFGNTSGGLADSGREAVTGTSYILGTDSFKKGILRKYSTTIGGKRARQMLVVPDFDSRIRPWYRAAVEKGDAVWSDIYILFTGQDMAISASKPVYDGGGKLLGVVSVDLSLSQINSFLSGMNIGKTGLSFIVDPDGFLVAASVNESIISSKKEGDVQGRIRAAESGTPMIRYAAESLVKRFGSFKSVRADENLEFVFEREQKYMKVTPVLKKYGLDWLIVTVLPESDFMDKINSNNRITFFLMFLSVVVSLILSYFTTKRIAGPVLMLKSSVGKLGSGVWPENYGGGRIYEIDDLQKSFFQMSGELKKLIETLNAEVRERKLTEGALRESEERYRELLQFSNSIIFRLDDTGRIIYANDFALKFFGYSMNELLLKSPVGTVVPRTDRSGNDLEKMIEEIVSNPELFEINENENIRKDGSTAWIVWSNRGITDSSGRLSEILCIGTDITERKLAEVEIKRLLGEKELLLHEIHHRIKNNMNTVAGLLYLQSLSIENEQGSSALRDAHSRVLSMMLIYDKLFRSSDFSSMTTKSYLSELITGIISTFPDFGKISIRTDIEDYILDTNTLIPVGIILNELLTNAYKYAFPEHDGLIEIAFRNSGENFFELVFRDNGVGVPESMVLGESSGFGLNLIFLLTEQMRGTAEIIRDKGTAFVIKFLAVMR